LQGKGKIAEGFDADLVLVDLQLQQTIRNEEQETKSKWSPWHGVTLTGWPVRTWVMGHEVFRLDAGKKHFDTSRFGHEIKFDPHRKCRWP
jgi:dihydroorotase